MSNYYVDVGEFHRKFDIPAFDPRKPCVFPSTEIVDYRMKFLEEELQELRDAVATNDLPEVLDALADLVYVVLGTAHYFNAPFAPIWVEVQRSNMDRVKVSPENCPPEKKYRPDLVIKPPDWSPPRILSIIEHQNSFARRMLRRNR